MKVANLNINLNVYLNTFFLIGEFNSAGGGDGNFFAIIFPKFISFLFYVRFLVKAVGKPMLPTEMKEG